MTEKTNKKRASALPSGQTTTEIEKQDPKLDYPDYEHALEMSWKSKYYFLSNLVEMLKDTGKNDPRKNWDTDYVRMNTELAGSRNKIVEQKIQLKKYYDWRKKKQITAAQ